MDIGVVSMRYAKALIEYAKENRAEDTLYKEMKMLSRNLSAFPNLKEALSNPVLNIREKYSLICAAATGDQGVSRTFSRGYNYRIQIYLVMFPLDSCRTLLIHYNLKRTIVINHLPHRPNCRGKHHTLHRGLGRGE